jgi:hypothetical protein
MKFSSRLALFVLGLFTLALGQAQTFAQTGPELARRPWRDEQMFEVQTSVMAIFEGGTTSSTYSMARNTTSGRVKVPLPDDFRMNVGYDHKFYNISTDQPGVPNQLIDQTMAVSLGLPKQEKWTVDFTLGGGIASNMQYTDDHAYYAKINAMATYEIDDTSEITFGINFDGNRPFLPDVPLPGVAYTKRIGRTLTYMVGFPFATVRWMPQEQLSLYATATPGSFVGGIGYKILPKLEAYADFNEHFDGFWVNGNPDNDRLFIQIRRAEAGFRVPMCNNFEMVLGGGFAFNTQARHGWDTRNDSLVARFSDEPFLRAGFTVRF